MEIVPPSYIIVNQSHSSKYLSLPHTEVSLFVLTVPLWSVYRLLIRSTAWPENTTSKIPLNYLRNSIKILPVIYKKSTYKYFYQILCSFLLSSLYLESNSTAQHLYCSYTYLYYIDPHISFTFSDSPKIVPLVFLIASINSWKLLIKVLIPYTKFLFQFVMGISSMRLDCSLRQFLSFLIIH